jgi:hypothetical protein
MNLFLVPASSENIDSTITRSVHIEMAKHYLTPVQIEVLERTLGDSKTFNCWAMSENKSGVFRSMNPGDLILFSIKGTGRFDYMANVVVKFENRQFGEALWDVVPGRPWELIYVLENIENVGLNKNKVVSTLGYSSDFKVPGVIRVRSEFLRRVINKYGSIEAFINAMRNYV